MMQFSFFFTAIQQEKSQVQLIDGIEGFKRTSLKHTETVEKNPLPTKETIDQVNVSFYHREYFILKNFFI